MTTSDNELFKNKTSEFLRIAKNIPDLPRFRTPVRDGITRFFDNQPEFDIRKTSVLTAAARPGTLEGIEDNDAQAVIDALCEMQRTFAFASDLKEFRALMGSDLTSAFKIASMSIAELVTKTSAFSLGNDKATGIHDRATKIAYRNQSVLTSLHESVRGSSIAAVDGGSSRNDRFRILADVGGNTIKNINLEVLFGAMDRDPCDDCNSVTSPAAYFVELLQFLRNNNLDPDNKITKSGGSELTDTVLKHLFARRPDLGNLQLTCPNTTAILPYIDLANEVMESFVVHLDRHTFDKTGRVTQAQLDVHNSSGTTGEGLSEPQHTNFHAYAILSTKLYPFHKLPYNQALDEVRTFLGHLGTSRYELLETSYPGPVPSIQDSGEDNKGYKHAMVAEYLNLTHEEYFALTGESFGPNGLQMTDEWKYWGYADNTYTDESTYTKLNFIKEQFLPRSGISFSDLVDLLKTEYINPMTKLANNTAIVIMNDGENDMRYRLALSSSGWVGNSDCERIRKFIHLWHRLGWTIDETDKAICGAAGKNAVAINAAVLRELVSMVKLHAIMKLEPSKLLTFWSQISMQGADSLYSQLFLTSGAIRADPILLLDKYGCFFSLAKISEHEPLVMATLGLTQEGLHAIKLPNDDLSLENLSNLYRHSLMAQFLRVTPTILLEMMVIFGNPFTSPTSCLKFVELWKRMGDMGFTFAQLMYVIGRDNLIGMDDPVSPVVLSNKGINETIMLLLAGTETITGNSPGCQIKKRMDTDLINTTISKALGLPIEMTKVLLSNIKINEITLLEIILSFTSQEKTVSVQSISLFSLLSRASVFISGFKLSSAEVKLVLANEAGFKGFMEGMLSLEGWKILLTYSELRDSLSKGANETLLNLLVWKPPGNTTPKQKVQRIADLMFIEKGTVKMLMDRFGLPGDISFQDVTVLTKLKKASDYAKKLRIDGDTLHSWSSPLADFQHTHQVAQKIRGSIRARVTNKDWEKIVKPIQDRLRENKRDALIAYLLAQPQLIKWGVVDADSLFEFFLIDVQMGPCLETSRIKQAISTVQVFVQRCLCGLEERYGVPNHALDHKRWEWMKNYRMWEANRKVFLYPENWIEPSLRDDKSPFFLEFEADLMKDLDSKSMEAAVKNYISRVNEVANLYPVTLLADGGVVHLFSRTRSTPFVYYYRSCDPIAKQWKPWETMDVEIQYHDDHEVVGQGGAFLIPAMIGGRLIVFTPQIIKQVKKEREKEEERAVNTIKPLPTVEYFEIKLGWSEYRNGKWTPKRMSPAAMHSRPQTTMDHRVRKLHFSIENPTTTGAEIVIDRIGKFEFKDGCCTVTKNIENQDFGATDKYQFNKAKDDETVRLTASSVGWTVSDSPPVLYIPRNNEDEDRQKYLRKELAQKEAYMSKVKEMPISGKARMVDRLEEEIKIINERLIPKSFIRLTHGVSAGLLTHTSASATLDSIFTYLHTLTDDECRAIPPNELDSPCGLYDWELGVHAPMLLMDKLTSSHQYDKAIEIARFVFNPMASGADCVSPLRVWKWAPFRELSARASFTRIFSGNDLPPNKSSKEVNNWRNTPFQPHAVARDRPVTYMKWIVMRYIKILIAAGDQLFRQETMESMPLAIQYYTLAAHLYGPPLQEIPKHTKTTPKTFNTLMDKWNAFSNAMVSFENAFPFTNSASLGKGTHGAGFQLGYFCVPSNPEIRDLRTQINDRLYRIRHCQDINGITHKLALFAPPIDPGALVHAAAAGLSLSSVLESISGPMPNYRFQYLLRGALEVVQELKSLAGSFLSAKEKMDSEAYQRIRTNHESTINAMVLNMKKMSRDEANRAIESLRESREGPFFRLNHFLTLLGEDEIKASSNKFKLVNCNMEKPTGSLKTNTFEKLETTFADVASGMRSAGACLAGISALTLTFPSPEVNTAPMGVGLSLKAGPINVAEGFRAASIALECSAGITQHLADSAARTNMFTRQYQDRVLQANSAGLELNSINAQIKTQEVRASIVEKDIELQVKQIETAKATEEFLRSKYTNEDLYSWQETQLRTLHYQTYTVAYDLAKKVEKSYQFERGLTDSTSNFIFSTWNSSRDGLLAAETLGLGLRRLEAAYQQSRGHDFEITKHISLRQIDPIALLNLRSINWCAFSLSESLFDMDFPGHHMRRLKSVSLSLPCVVGPYTSANCTLELMMHSYRLGTANEITPKELNYVPIHSVAFSSSQNDPGVFELNFHDERYLPFEGAGVISSWRLSLPKFHAFDYNTISDVVMHLRYTSIAGCGTGASERLRTRGNEEDVLFASFDLRNEFGSTWQQLGSGQPMTLSNLKERLPWWTTKYDISVVEVNLFTSTVPDQFVPLVDEDEFVFQIQTDSTPVAVYAHAPSIGSTTFVDGDKLEFGTWLLTMTKPKSALTDLWMVVRYKADLVNAHYLPSYTSTLNDGWSRRS